LKSWNHLIQIILEQFSINWWLSYCHSTYVINKIFFLNVKANNISDDHISNDIITFSDLLFEEWPRQLRAGVFTHYPTIQEADPYPWWIQVGTFTQPPVVTPVSPTRHRRMIWRPRNTLPQSGTVIIQLECRVEKIRCQFHQHFSCAFFTDIFLPIMKPKRNKRKAEQSTFDQKRTCKMLMKLAPGLHEICTTECVTDLD
jgi:hypothetical protein